VTVSQGSAIGDGILDPVESDAWEIGRDAGGSFMAKLAAGQIG